MNQTPTENNDVCHAAAGNLSFLLSVIRCGEQLSPDEEAAIQKTIRRLKVAEARVEALEGYVTHKDGCAVGFGRCMWRESDRDVCTCGLSALRSGDGVIQKDQG